MLDPVLTAADLTVTRGERRILNGASVEVGETEDVLVQGKSGAGKTTLFSVLGLLERPDSGTLEIDGTETTELSGNRRAALRRETIGTIFQDFKLIPDLTARENVAVPMEHSGTVDDDWLDTLLSELDITELADRRPASLSGGEKQRVAIGRALANRPAILLADEPTGQLDPETTNRVMELLFACQAEFDTALIVVSHDTGITGEFNRVVHLEDGQLTEQSV
jgi:ABC-type lipoprotein export system ATPase subunit